MTTTAAPQLRRSKRKLAEQGAETVPETTKNNAGKRARKAKADETAMDSVSVQLKQRSATLPPFLALPRELRDEIYRHVLQEDHSSTLKTGTGKNIVTRCGLTAVNNQISEEFLDAVLFHAPVITATVRNHNFSHVVTFLNRLSKAQLTKLSTRGLQVAGPKRRIRIILSYSAGAKDSRIHLNRWLDRFDVPEKRGKDIDFEYHGDGTYRNGGYKQRPRERDTASARWKEEARKITRGAIKGSYSWSVYRY